MIYKGIVTFELGKLVIEADEEAVDKIYFSNVTIEENCNDIVELAKQQLNEYFAGLRKQFDFPIKLQGTVFQQRVYRALLTVPYGSTVSYKALTIMAGNKRGFQATGSAVGKNKLMIVVPCHRVINENGNIGGYAGGIDIKRYLLNLEGTFLD